MKTLLSYLSYTEKRKKSREQHFQWLLSEPTTVCKKVSLTPGQESLLCGMGPEWTLSKPSLTPTFDHGFSETSRHKSRAIVWGSRHALAQVPLNHPLDTFGCKVCEGKLAWRIPGRESWQSAASSPMFKSKSFSKVFSFPSFLSLVHGCLIYRTSVYSGDGVRYDYDFICDFYLLQLACSPKE